MKSLSDDTIEPEQVNSEDAGIDNDGYM